MLPSDKLGGILGFLIRALFAVGFVVGATAPACAQKGKGGGGEVPPGTIFFEHQATIWAMKGDGSNKQPISLPWDSVMSPSRLVYGSDPYFDRWWLTVAPALDVEGNAVVYDLLLDANAENIYTIEGGWEPYLADGTQWSNWPQMEVVAVRPRPDGSVVKVQVTDLFGAATPTIYGWYDSIIPAGVRWSNDGLDSFISFPAYDWRSTFSVDPETGVTSVRYDNSSPTSTALLRVSVSGIEINSGMVPWSPDTPQDLQFLLAGNQTNYAWSPDGGELAKVQTGSVAVYAGSPLVLNRALAPVSSESSSPRWSPDGGKIAFDSQGILYVVPADGSAAPKALLSPKGRTSYVGDASRDAPAWSPDSKQILTTQVTESNTFSFNKYALVRVSATGGSPSDLTGDIGGANIVYGWVSDTLAP